MKVIKKIILAVLLTIFILGVFDLFYTGNDGWQLESFKNFKKNIIAEHDFITDLAISGISPNTYIYYELDKSKNVPLEKISEVFNETKKFFLSPQIFLELQKFHDDRYGGDIVCIQINFSYPNKDGKFAYTFSSEAEGSNPITHHSFKHWSNESLLNGLLPLSDL